MVDLIAGAFCTNKAGHASRLMAPLHSSVFADGSESTLIADERLTVFASNKTIASRFEANVFIAYLGEITGYLVPIPYDDKNDNLDILRYLYEQHGIGFARHVNGHFVIILWDKNNDQFLLIQDKFPGIKTCYWSRTNEYLFFSNYIKPLLVIRPECRKTLNKRGLYKFLKHAYISAPDTIFEGISQIDAGELLKVKGGKLTKEMYDPWRFASEKITDKTEALENYKELLDGSIKSYCSNHSQCGFFLSGGYDSSVNVAIGKKHISNPIVTIGVGSENLSSDAPFARKVSDLCKTTHYEYNVKGPEIDDLPLIIWQTENPYYDPGIILTHCAMRLAKLYVKCVIGGDGVDQFFGSCSSVVFSRYCLTKKSGGLYRLVLEAINRLFSISFLESNFFLQKVKSKLIGKYDVNDWIGGYGFRNCDIKYILRKKFYFEQSIDNWSVPDHDLAAFFEFCCTVVKKPYVLHSILFKTGRMSDLHGISTFSPYFDKNVFNFILSLDHSLRTPPIDGKPGEFDKKYLHKELARSLLSPEIFKRPKQGGAINPYIHLNDANRLSAIKKVVLKSDFIREYFNIGRLETLFKYIETAETAKAASVNIMQILTLSLWHHIFIEKDPGTAPNFTLDDYLAS